MTPAHTNMWVLVQSTTPDFELRRFSLSSLTHTHTHTHTHCALSNSRIHRQIIKRRLLDRSTSQNTRS